ncbi:hypothetical protein DPMN_040106 [Dreissena polymorpha]|uniref:Uncharacterized protein n=1 Tax=Dreissena polymorpha TaxID=45954 RepID=A0A9D4HUZ9_DREPO|nr:hypothetical protein DPMN_040106 [Dreissena polymorpha]
MSKFHEDWGKMCLLNCSYKTAPLLGAMEKDTCPVGHVFLPIQTIIELSLRSPSLSQMNRSQDGYKKNAPPLGSHIHEDRKINVASRVLTRKNAPPPGGHVFLPTDIIFERPRYQLGVNLLTKFHEDRPIMWASRVHIKEKCPAPCSHVFRAKHQSSDQIHEDWTINVASRELTSQMLTPHNARRTKGDHKSSP